MHVCIQITLDNSEVHRTLIEVNTVIFQMKSKILPLDQTLRIPSNLKFSVKCPADFVIVMYCPFKVENAN